MSDRNLMVACPACRARVGAPCLISKPHHRDKWVEGVHSKRWVDAQDAIEREIGERAAQSIAAWLDSLAESTPGQSWSPEMRWHAAGYRSLAAEIRAGKWRRPPQANQGGG